MTEQKYKTPTERNAETVIARLKEGAAPWQMSYIAGQTLPSHNPVTGTVYSGLNRVMLSFYQHMDAQGNYDSRWLTFDNAKDAGLLVNSGAKSQQIKVWEFKAERPVLDEATAKPLMGEDGKPVMETVYSSQPRLRYANVFHMSQLSNKNGLDVPGLYTQEHSPKWFERAAEWNDEIATAILRNSGAAIVHDQDMDTYYDASDDSIHMPPMENFKHPGSYYTAALGALSSWTQHPERLNRERGPNGSEMRAKEELRVRMAHWMLAQDLGMDYEPDPSMAFSERWEKMLENDPYEFPRAVKDAEAIKTYIINLEKGLETENTGQQVHPNGFNMARFEVWRNRWEQADPENILSISPDGRITADKPIFLEVPYKDKEMVSGKARWDTFRKLWQVPEGQDLRPYSAWLPVKELNMGQAVLGPVEEFARKLYDAGFNMEEPPIMDGQTHRAPVVGGKSGARDGVYQAELSERPEGFYRNYITNVRHDWIYSGHELTDEQIDKLKTETLERAAQESARKAELYESAAMQAYAKWEMAAPATPEHEYFATKGVYLPDKGFKQDDKGNLLIPGVELEDHGELLGFKIKTLQTITPYGRKYYEKGCEKSGAMFVFETKDYEVSQKQTKEILITEDFINAATLYMATGTPVVACFDSYNMQAVAENVRKHFPDAKITICADNDLDMDRNHGFETAKEVAKVINASVVVPIFTKAEMEQSDIPRSFNGLLQMRGEDGLAAIVKCLKVEQGRSTKTEVER